MQSSQIMDMGERDGPISSQTRVAIKRTVFTRHQLLRMEDRFACQTFLSKEERKQFADELCLGERQVMIWFQNRRGRLKRRGPSDKAYSASKLEELTNRRPYPFITRPPVTLTSSEDLRPAPPGAVWPMYRQLERVSIDESYPIVTTTRKEAAHPNVNMFIDAKSLSKLDNSNACARQWMSCMVADNQQLMRQTYNVMQPYNNVISWSCDALRPSASMFGVPPAAVSGQLSNTQSSRWNLQLPVWNDATQDALRCGNISANPSPSDHSQSTEVAHFGLDACYVDTAQSECRQDCFGTSLSECVPVL